MVIVGLRFWVVIELTGVVTGEDSSVDDFLKLFFVDAGVPGGRRNSTVVAGGSSDEDFRVICGCRIGPMGRSVILASCRRD